MPFALVFNRHRQVPVERSPAFAHVAERCRRAGELQRAVSLCRDGLARFPDHVSARVTLGLALSDLGSYAEARVELRQALKLAPDNLAAIRGMAHLHDQGAEPEGPLESEVTLASDEALASEVTLASDEALASGVTLASDELLASELTLASDERLASDLALPSEEPVAPIASQGVIASDEWLVPDETVAPLAPLAADASREGAPVMSESAAAPIDLSAFEAELESLEVLEDLSEVVSLDTLDPVHVVPAEERARPTPGLDAFDPDDLGPGDIDAVVSQYRETLPLDEHQLDAMAIGLDMEALDTRVLDPMWATVPMQAAGPMQATDPMHVLHPVLVLQPSPLSQTVPASVPAALERFLSQVKTRRMLLN